MKSILGVMALFLGVIGSSSSYAQDTTQTRVGINVYELSTQAVEAVKDYYISEYGDKYVTQYDQIRLNSIDFITTDWNDSQKLEVSVTGITVSESEIPDFCELVFRRKDTWASWSLVSDSVSCGPYD